MHWHGLEALPRCPGGRHHRPQNHRADGTITRKTTVRTAPPFTKPRLGQPGTNNAVQPVPDWTNERQRVPAQSGGHDRVLTANLLCPDGMIHAKNLDRVLGFPHSVDDLAPRPGQPGLLAGRAIRTGVLVSLAAF